MNRSIPIIIAVVLGLITAVFGRDRGCKSKGVDGASTSLQTLERDYFKVAVPEGWKTVINVDQPQVGEYKLEYPKTKEFVDIAWQTGEPVTAEEFHLMAGAIETAFGPDFKLERKSEGSTDELIRHEVLGELKIKGDKAWILLDSVQCMKTNVNVNITIATVSRESATALAGRMRATFACRGDQPLAPVAAKPVVSNLPDTWGYSADADAETLVRNDDSVMVMVSRTSSGVYDGIKEYPEQISNVLGSLLESKLSPIEGSFKQITGLGNTPVRAFIAEVADGDFGGSKVGIAAMKCEITYVLMSLVAEGVSEDPLAVLEQFGCPGAEGGQPLAERKSACELGLADYCEPAAEAPAP